MAYFGHPFGIPVRWTSVLVHDNNLRFRCDAVEEFFNIITECGANVIRVLLCVLQEHDVVEG